jgi:hypothetical protein
MNKQTTFEGREQILLFLVGPQTVFQQFWKIYWSWIKEPIGIKSLDSEPIGNNEDLKEIQ